MRGAIGQLYLPPIRAQLLHNADQRIADENDADSAILGPADGQNGHQEFVLENVARGAEVHTEAGAATTTSAGTASAMS